MTRLETEMAHMAKLLACPTSFPAWAEYLTWKADRLAIRDQEYASLPSMLGAEIARLKSKHSQSKQQRTGTP